MSERGCRNQLCEGVRGSCVCVGVEGSCVCEGVGICVCRGQLCVCVCVRGSCV